MKSNTPKKKSFWEERIEQREKEKFGIDNDDSSQEFDKHMEEVDRDIAQKEKEFDQQQRAYK